jgi:hypothetical protein
MSLIEFSSYVNQSTFYYQEEIMSATSVFLTIFADKLGNVNFKLCSREFQPVCMK